MKQTWGYGACEQLWASIGLSSRLTPWGRASKSLESFRQSLERATVRRGLLSRSQRNSESIWEHIYDSLNALQLIEPEREKKIVDVGSGNGFPGVPLAIALPIAQFVLVEQSSWKADYLIYMTGTLGLANTKIVNETFSAVLLERHNPELITFRALDRVGDISKLVWMRTFACPLLVFATVKTEESWRLKLAAEKMHIRARHEYELKSRSVPRVILKFSRD